MRYGPLRQIWWCAMGHCGWFGNALWATAWNEVQICDDFFAVGHSVGFGSALWATHTAQGSVTHYGPKCRNFLRAMVNSAGFGYALWAIAPNQLLRRRDAPIFLKPCQFLSRDSEVKRRMHINSSAYSRSMPSRCLIYGIWKNDLMFRSGP